MKPTRPPRRPSQSRLRNVPSSISPNQRSPPMCALLGNRFIAPRAETDFPEPDSPTRARVSPRRTSSDNSLTTGVSPQLIDSLSSRSRGEEERSDIGLGPGQWSRAGSVLDMAWIECITQPLANEHQQ